jgi:hypothetical protein
MKLRSLSLVIGFQVLSVLCAASGALARTPVKWQEMPDGGETFYLRQEVAWSPEIRLAQGQAFKFVDLHALPAIAVSVLELDVPGCAFAEKEADIEIFKPLAYGPPPTRDNSVGVRVLRGCRVEVFIEYADLGDYGLFEQ